jgi:acyl carrier protein
MAREIEKELRTYVGRHLDVKDLDKITRNAKLKKDLGADSLDSIEMIMEIEEMFDIDIPEDDADKIKTFGALVDYVANHYKEKDEEKQYF